MDHFEINQQRLKNPIGYPIGTPVLQVVVCLSASCMPQEPSHTRCRRHEPKRMQFKRRHRFHLNKGSFPPSVRALAGGVYKVKAHRGWFFSRSLPSAKRQSWATVAVITCQDRPIIWTAHPCQGKTPGPTGPLGPCWASRVQVHRQRASNQAYTFRTEEVKNHTTPPKWKVTE